MNKYLCWIQDYGQSVEDGIEVHAYDAEEAAKEYVMCHERYEADYPVASGQVEIDVHVFAKGEDHRTYTVYGELTPTYYVRRVQE